MGGYGALKLGLSKPENFAAVASLSGAVVLADVESLLLVRNEAYWQGIFGPLDQIQGSVNDPVRLLNELVDSGTSAPRFSWLVEQKMICIQLVNTWHIK